MLISRMSSGRPSFTQDRARLAREIAEAVLADPEHRGRHHAERCLIREDSSCRLTMLADLPRFIPVSG